MRRILILIIVTALILLGAASALARGAPDVQFVRIATGGTGGNFYRLGAGIASVWNDEIDGIVASTQSTDGSPHNAELLAGGEVEIAFMGADISRDAFHNTGRFADEEPGRYEVLNFMTYLYPNPQMFLVMEWAADDIRTMSDVVGKRVSKGAIGSLGEVYFLETMEVLGIDPGSVIQEHTVHGAAIDQVRNRQIDVVMWPDAAGSASHMEILETGWAEARSLDPEVRRHFTSGGWDINFEYTLPANTYRNQPNDVHTFAAPIVLLAHADLDEELVYQLTKAVHENQRALVAVADLLARFMTPETALNGMAVPLHPGAERFYREAGVLD
ncbi:MAG: TAXI family TRAP transporter solute-binding subunit [Spirochaetaceae bacterium]|nr:MAG: TAXI family TRAP transporter solute-binding subunit [Spirochaetaceae bacterium]